MVFIDNTSPRHDVNLQVMDIHDGNLMQWEAGGRYYWYGLGYQNCTLSRIYMPPQYCPGVFQPFGEGCGFRDDHVLHVYSSADLVQWTHESDALPFATRPRGIYFRPKVVFDKRTSEYVLWINYLRQEGSTWPLNTPVRSYQNNISAVVAKSTSPVGPFRIVNPWARLQVDFIGDFALLVDPNDPDHAAYIAYDAWNNGHRVRIERLNDDWTASAALLDPSLSTGDLTDADVEAPILFERKGHYYLIYGSTCCFCAEGGSAEVQVASHPLGPWSRTGVDLNAWGAGPAGACGRPVPSQNNFVATVPTRSGEIAYLFMGDLWTSAPDGLKSHDLQYWAPLSFDDTKVPPAIRPLEWMDGFDIDVPSAQPGVSAPGVASDGPFRAGSGLLQIRANQASCSHSGTFEAWLLTLILATFAALLLACCWACRAACRARRGGGGSTSGCSASCCGGEHHHQDLDLRRRLSPRGEQADMKGLL